MARGVDLLGLPRTAVTNMETGKRAVSTLELTKLAEIYRRSPALFLDGDDAADSEDLSTVLHRAFPEIKQDIEIEAGVFRVLDLYREGAALRSMLDQTIEQTVPSYSSKMRTVGDAIRQGETVAEEERRRLGLGTAPVSDIAALINKQGIWTAATNLPEALSGLFINHPSIGLAILINARHWPVRRRFLALGILRLRARRRAEKVNELNRLREFGLDFCGEGSVCDTDAHTDRERP